MKIYNLTIDIGKPITKRMSIPQNTQRYGLAVKALKNGEPVGDFDVTITDGSDTLTPETTMEDGSKLFAMSSIGTSSRKTKVSIATKVKVIPGGTLEVPARKLGKFYITTPAGTYAQSDIDIAGYKTGARIKSGDIQVALDDKNDWQSTNADVIVLFDDASRGQVFYDKTQQSQVLGYPVPVDTPITFDKDIKYVIGIYSATDATYTIADTTIGRVMTASVDLWLNETKFAFPDMDIEENG